MRFSNIIYESTAGSLTGLEISVSVAYRLDLRKISGYQELLLTILEVFMAGWVLSTATCVNCWLEYVGGHFDASKHAFTYRKAGEVHVLYEMGPLRLNDGLDPSQCPTSPLTFCGPKCCLAYLHKHLVCVHLHWVPLGPCHEDGCFECGKGNASGYIPVGGPYGSIFDSGSCLAYLCSVQCLKKALRRDERFQRSGMCYTATGVVLPWYAQ